MWLENCTELMESTSKPSTWEKSNKAAVETVNNDICTQVSMSFNIPLYCGSSVVNYWESTSVCLFITVICPIVFFLWKDHALYFSALSSWMLSHAPLNNPFCQPPESLTSRALSGNLLGIRIRAWMMLHLWGLMTILGTKGNFTGYCKLLQAPLFCIIIS